jgi:hypothetical protein
MNAITSDPWATNGREGNDMAAVKPETGTSLTGYWGTDNSQHVNFIGLDDHVHELYIAPGAGWVDNDLTELATAQANLPAKQSGLSGYWQSHDSSVHVFYYGSNFGTSDNHVYQLEIFPGGPGWLWENLSATANAIAPEVCRALNGYWGTDDSQHIDYIAVDNHIHELYRPCGASPTDWTDGDLTALAGAVAPHQNTALVSYWAADSSQHVFFIGVDNHVHHLSIAHGADWSDQDLTTLLAGDGAMPNVNTALAGFVDDEGGRHLFYVATDGDIHELYSGTGAIPGFDHSLTKVAHAVAPNLGTALGAYQGTDNSHHINFFGVDGHVHEIYGSPQNAGSGFVDNDLTKLANAVDPIVGDAGLHGYWGSDSSQHVNFIGVDGDLHELYIAPGTNGWVANDLTALA